MGKLAVVVELPVAGKKSLDDNRSSSKVAAKTAKARSGVGSETRKRMRSRSGQKGQVVRKGDVWHGRFYVDVPGQQERVRKSVPIGLAAGEEKLTKSEAKNKLQEYCRSWE